MTGAAPGPIETPNRRDSTVKAPDVDARIACRPILTRALAGHRPKRESRVRRAQNTSSTKRWARTRKWAITLLATALSTYALDGVATAAGVLLAASHVLRGSGTWLLLLLLAGTYVLWGAALWVNLQANWTMLEETGMSTNVLSKAAYELAKLRPASLRTQRIASASGYVGTEIAKEVPYYAAAFGAVLLSDSVSSTDALIFLAGTNLGAAAYEYGLARITRAFLHLKTTRRAVNPPLDPSAHAGPGTDVVPRERMAEHQSGGFPGIVLGRAPP
jgi:hypothetical protein